MIPSQKTGMAKPKRERIVTTALPTEAGRWAPPPPGGPSGTPHVNHGRVSGGQMEEDEIQDHDPDNNGNRLQSPPQDVNAKRTGAQEMPLNLSCCQKRTRR